MKKKQKQLIEEKWTLWMAVMSGSGSSVFGLFAPDITIPDINFGERSFVFKGKL